MAPRVGCHPRLFLPLHLKHVGTGMIGRSCISVIASSHKPDPPCKGFVCCILSHSPESAGPRRGSAGQEPCGWAAPPRVAHPGNESQDRPYTRHGVASIPAHRRLPLGARPAAQAAPPKDGSGGPNPAGYICSPQSTRCVTRFSEKSPSQARLTARTAPAPSAAGDSLCLGRSSRRSRSPSR